MSETFPMSKTFAVLHRLHTQIEARKAKLAGREQPSPDDLKDFSSAVPAAVARLEWWENELREAAEQDAVTLERVRRLVSVVDAKDNAHHDAQDICKAIQIALEQPEQSLCPACLRRGCDVWGYGVQGLIRIA